MPVQNVMLKVVEARRFQEPQAKQQIRIDHNSNLTLVQEEQDGRMRVEFGYTTSYGALGVVKVEGSLWFLGDDVPAAVEQWTKSRNLPQKIAQEVHSAIMATCVPDAVGLAKMVRMPPPIPLPQVRFGQGAQAGASSQAPGDTPEVG